MAAINFYITNTGADFDINTAGSGLGFYGDGGFGASVAVGTYQGRTYVTDGNGVVQGIEANNVKFLNAGSGILGQAGSGIGLQAIPNYQATVNVRFTHSSAVNVQNVEARIYDRSNINNAASGVLTKVAEIVHTSNIQEAATGSGDDQWIEAAGSGTVVGLVNSPAQSGIFAGDGTSTVTDVRHDWYLSISGSPSSIGSKSAYGMYVSLEYL